MASLTDTQTRYLALAWLCFDAEPKVNILSSCTATIDEHSKLYND